MPRIVCSIDHRLRKSHQFGGCDRLLGYYATIGRELLRCETGRMSYRYSAQRLQREFGQGVCHIPVEVLESYLEDLLERSVTEESLFVCRSAFSKRVHSFMLAGLVCALSAGIWMASAGVLLVQTFLFTLLLAFPFALFLHLHPSGGLARRLMFAHLVSREIARRRGDGRSGYWGVQRFVLAELLGGTGAESAQGAAMNLYPSNLYQ